ncbi:MAG TPA: phage holin family protein [Oligoflexia bacterium]|nr:phage holin family protein [Oligoflexia bacterium]HMP47634.1 phage holin family protein [Oligoflexia bacterium]
MNEAGLLNEFNPWGMFNHGINQLIAMGLTIFLIPRLYVTNPLSALGILGSIAIVNATLWDPNLFFGIPDSLSGTALKLFLANGILFWILVKLMPGIRVEGILPALVAPVVFSVLSSLLHFFLSDFDWFVVIGAGLEQLSQFKESINEQ